MTPNSPTPPTPMAPGGPVPLVIAAHGTRDPDGEADAHELVAAVAAALPGVAVQAGFIELSDPPLPEALSTAAASLGERGGPIVVVPLMLGEAGHAKEDIPRAIAATAAAHPRVAWHYGRVLGPHDDLVAALVERVTLALAGDPAAGTAVVLVGRGSSDAHGNAGLAHTARLLLETGGYDAVETAYVDVTRPTIGQGLERARLVGAERVVVVPYVLFRGLMRSSVADQVAQWRAGRADTRYRTPAPGRTYAAANDAEASSGAARAGLDVRIADVIGGCAPLVRVVLERYAQALSAPSTGGADASADDPSAHPASNHPDPHSHAHPHADDDAGEPGREVVGDPDPARPFPPYVSALSLQDRRVLVVGAGAVARRKIAGLLAAGAQVEVVAPDACAPVAAWADTGRLAWRRRPFRPSDVNEAWYVLACADDPAVGAAVADAAAERRVFCVRADDAAAGTAWTPAVGHRAGVTLAVLANRDPRRAVRVRDALLTALDAEP